MKIAIEIPKEFEEHFNNDKFEDSLLRIETDIGDSCCVLFGNYEIETVAMLKNAFKKSEVIK